MVGHYYTESKWEDRLRSDKDAVFVLEDLRKDPPLVMGTAAFQFLSGDVASVYGVFLADGYQRQGLGQHLLKQLEKEAAAQGVKVLQLDANLAAYKFYGKQDYSHLGPMWWECSWEFGRFTERMEKMQKVLS